ncbi:MAG: hypothetical protein E7171_07210 [Firmicutes bacterium]|nr:hypothetical protein [Bacillota bacterium]
MTKKEAFRILRITHDIKYTYKNSDGSVTFMDIIDTYKAQAEADMHVGSYSITQTEIDDAYNFLQAQYTAKTTGARTTGSSSSKVAPILIGAGALLLTGAMIVGGIHMIGNLPKSNALPNEKPGYVQEDDREHVDYKDYASYMGDLTDEKAVEQRAEEILELFTQNGIVHSETNTPYTVEEIQTILQYMNGGILPEGVSVEAANTAYLNMIADMFNTKIVLYNSAYMVGAQIIDFDGNGNILDFEGNIVDINHIGFDESTGLTIIDPQYAHLYSEHGLGTSEQHFNRAVANYVPIDVTDFQFGDSTAYPYLEWFSAQYNKLMTTTDKNEKVAIFNQLTQSLADIVYGNGFQMKNENGETVLIQYTDFSDYDDVNDYNALRIVVSLYQGARSVVDLEDYELGRSEELVQTQDMYRIANNGGVSEVYIDDVLDVFNAACIGEDEEMHIYDENGVIVDGDNLDQRAYSNTRHLIEQNMANGDLSYWEDHYSLSK